MRTKGIYVGMLLLTISLLLISETLLLRSGNANSCVKPPVEKPPHNTVEYVETDCVFRAHPNDIDLQTDNCKRISRYVIVGSNKVYKHQYDPGSSDYSTYIVINDADATTFESLENGFYKDEQNLFYDLGENLTTIKGIDLKSVKVLSTHFIKDKYGVYLRDPFEKRTLRLLESFDTNTFEVIQNDRNHETYFKDKNGIYFFSLRENTTMIPIKIPNANPKTFEVIDKYQWAKDGTQVFYAGKTMAVEDPDTFVKVGPYFKDKVAVYGLISGEFKKSPHIDGCSYELINYKKYEWRGYAKDRQHVYYRNKLVEGADVSSFVVENEKAYDKNYEYQGIYRK